MNDVTTQALPSSGRDFEEKRALIEALTLFDKERGNITRFWLPRTPEQAVALVDKGRTVTLETRAKRTSHSTVWVDQFGRTHGSLEDFVWNNRSEKSRHGAHTRRVPHETWVTHRSRFSSRAGLAAFLDVDLNATGCWERIGVPVDKPL